MSAVAGAAPAGDHWSARLLAYITPPDENQPVSASSNASQRRHLAIWPFFCDSRHGFPWDEALRNLLREAVDVTPAKQNLPRRHANDASVRKHPAQASEGRPVRS